MNYQIVPGLHDRNRKEFLLQSSGGPKEDFLMERVCELMQVDPLELKSKSRKRCLVESRQILMYLMKEQTSLSLKKIGELLGGRDHSTVLYGIQVVQDLVDIDKHFRQRLAKIEAAITNPEITL